MCSLSCLTLIWSWCPRYDSWDYEVCLWNMFSVIVLVEFVECVLCNDQTLILSLCIRYGSWEYELRLWNVGLVRMWD